MTDAGRVDPAGIFASDNHRRVLAHLPTPDADYGYEVGPLLARLAQDPYTPHPADPENLDLSAEEDTLSEVLEDLSNEGYAKSYKGGIWRMTKAGFEKLTGPIKDEPAEGAEVVGPAIVGPLAPATVRTTAIG